MDSEGKYSYLTIDTPRPSISHFFHAPRVVLSFLTASSLVTTVYCLVVIACFSFLQFFSRKHLSLQSFSSHSECGIVCPADVFSTSCHWLCRECWDYFCLSFLLHHSLYHYSAITCPGSVLFSVLWPESIVDQNISSFSALTLFCWKNNPIFSGIDAQDSFSSTWLRAAHQEDHLRKRSHRRNPRPSLVKKVHDITTSFDVFNSFVKEFVCHDKQREQHVSNCNTIDIIFVISRDFGLSFSLF